MPDETVLRVERVTKTFGPVRAVDDLSFAVAAGTITGLLGRNGAGKTTTLRMINGIFLPDTGRIELLGAADVAAVRDRVGYLPEERGLYRKMKVIEHLLFLAEIKGQPLPRARQRAERWLERFELADKRTARVEELSKGNQQKVQIIGALLHDPELVILDEPLSGLDPVNVVLVRGILQELRASGKTVLLSTHMMGEAEKTVDDIVLIHRGTAVLAGGLDEVRAAHGTDTVHLAFEGDGAFLTTLPGVARARLDTNAAELELRPGACTQELLAAAMERLRILRFEVAAPSLEQIFIDKVGGGTPSEPAAGAAEVRR
ncbi:MAG TPA: ATP-binding cassette domain-containing protein [Thermoanaerobaculaceae bacterium]|nr:ATP-binding cassette domain-containing protein [Thermoanaerobaculaceae bacterium]HRS16911.1 ATP-binding cassette domain-containing protein [Thermoanaerobaculaceae bacterium]